MGPLAALFLQRLAVEEDVARDAQGIGDPALVGADARLIGGRIRLRSRKLVPVALIEQPAQLRHRIARPFGVDDRFGLVGLRILERVPLKARHRQAQQARALARARMRHRVLDESRGFFGLRAVAGQHVQALEAREVGGDVGAGCLEAGRHRRCRSRCPLCRKASAVSASSPWVSAAQKPLVATEASPPSTTPMAPSYSVLAQHRAPSIRVPAPKPAVGVYCAPTPPHIGAPKGPCGLG